MARQPIRKTKVVATIGPASDDIETIRAMIRAGMNVARLNFSHGSHDEHARRIETIRRASRDLDANVGIMFDTKGVEIRTNRVEGGTAELRIGEPFTLYTDGRIGNARGVSVSYAHLPDEVETGTTILLDDGKLELEVVGVSKDEIDCRIRRGGTLADRRGVNLPGTSLGVPAMSEENRNDLDFAVDCDVVYVAASFVRSRDDIAEIRQLFDERAANIAIIAKIESAEGFAHLEGIIAEADGIMVARGDLGVEMPIQSLPMVQKKIIRATVTKGKPVITATQMLDSMTRNPTPTRAEVSDVANAILDGTSAVMLSSETAMGSYPVEAVRTMASLALEAEASLEDYGHLQHIQPGPANVVTEAVSQAAITMAHHLDAAAILALTETGFTARSISKYRPRCPILGVTVSPGVVRRLSLNWGVTGLLCLEGTSPTSDELSRAGIERARTRGLVDSGDIVVVTAGVDRETGSTNLIRVVRVP